MDLMERLTADLNRIVKSSMFWYGLSIGVSGYLSIAPLFQPEYWNAKRQLYGFGALAITLPLAAWTGRKVEHFVTELQVTNQMRHQYEVDDIVHAVNYKRAVNAKEIRLINGAHSMGELQEMMVEQMRIMSDTMKTLKGSYIGQGQLPEAQEQSILPTVDVAELAASTLLDAENGGSILAAAPRRTGKSALQRATLRRVHNHTQGLVDFKVFAGKFGEKFCGLENHQDYIFSGAVSAIPEVIERISVYASLVERPNGQGLPTILISDEHNNTLGAAGSLKDNPEASKRMQKAGSLITYQTSRIVTQGASKQVNAFLSSHSPLVSDIGLNSQLQYSLKTLVLASHMNVEALEAVLFGTGTKKLIGDREIRNAIAEQYKAFCQSAPQKWFICLHNFGGDWQLCQLPDYNQEDSAAPPIEWGFCDASEEELIKFFEQDDEATDRQGVSTRDALNKLLDKEVDPSQINPLELTDEQLNRLIEEKRKKPEKSPSIPAQLIFSKYVQKEMNGRFISAKWVQNFAFRSKELSKISPDQIRGFFYELATFGLGEIAGEGDSLSWGIAPSE